MNFENRKYHYVYTIVDSLTMKQYIGSRSSNDPPEKDIGIKYFTSSNIVKPLFQADPKRFTYYFTLKESREEAFRLEMYMHELFDVARNPLYYNKAKQTSHKFHFDTTGAKWYHNPKTNEQIKCLPGKEPAGFIEGMVSNRGKKWYYNPESNEQVKCLPGKEPAGFVEGMILTKGSNNPNYGKKWYYNPESNEQVKCLPGKEPAGFIEGKILSNRGKKWYYCPKTNEQIFVTLGEEPAGFIEGIALIKGSSHPSYGKKWYYCPKTNEQIKCLPSEKPAGFIKGMVSNRGKKWYYNPKTNKQIKCLPDQSIPEGFIPGRINNKNG